ncbi:MAG TPA: SpoIID/LytB domain-containing protein [Candidatus Cloacimonadota bacterium]|nr:SpoIID/LytB domain-containing protein [Candidatus Cloacimonadota bacterium]
MRGLLCLLFCLCFSLILNAAELRAGELWLEIGLNNAPALDLSLPGTATFTDAGGLYSKSLSGRIQLSLADQEHSVSYRFFDRSLPWTAGSDSAEIREKAIWQDGRLSFQKESLLFYPQLFSSREAALDYGKSTGLSASRIQAQAFSGEVLKLSTAQGELIFLELPVRIQSSGYLSPDQGKLNYKGEFVIKTLGNRLQLNQIIRLESYLGGVVQHEIGNNAPPEALKAQTIAARTHAVRLLLYDRHSADGFDLCNSTHCQVYKGDYLQTPAVRDAIDETTGEIMVYLGKVIDATYHSSCGGKTDSSSQIWGSGYTPYLSGVTCDPAADSLNLSTEADAIRWIETKGETRGMSSWEKASQYWTKTVKKADLAKAVDLPKLRSVKILERGKSGRILKLEISSGDASLILDSEAKIRKAFGGLPSSFFYIVDSEAGKIQPGGDLVLHGKGSGHGVGMCQVGALRLAREGKPFDAILGQYYPGTRITIDWIAYEE